MDTDEIVWKQVTLLSCTISAGLTGVGRFQTDRAWSKTGILPKPLMLS